MIDTSLLIAKKDILKDADDKLKFGELNSGISQFGHYVYVGQFGILEAQVASSKAAYLAAIILSEYEGKMQKFSPTIPLSEFLIVHPEFNFLNKRLKFVAQGEALFYWCQTINLLYPGNKSS